MHLSCDVWEAQGAVSKYSEFKSKIPFKKIQTSAATFCFHVTDFHSFIWDVTDFFFVGTFQKKYKKDCLKIIFVGIWKGLLFMQTQCICQLMEMKKMWTSTGEKLSKQQWRGTSDIGLTSEGNMCWSFIFKWKCWYQTRIETRSLLDIVRNVGALLPFIWKKKKIKKKEESCKRSIWWWKMLVIFRPNWIYWVGFIYLFVFYSGDDYQTSSRGYKSLFPPGS